MTQSPPTPEPNRLLDTQEERERQARIEILLLERNAYKILMESKEREARLLGWCPREEKPRS